MYQSVRELNHDPYSCHTGFMDSEGFTLKSEFPGVKPTPSSVSGTLSFPHLPYNGLYWLPPPMTTCYSNPVLLLLSTDGYPAFTHSLQVDLAFSHQLLSQPHHHVRAATSVVGADHRYGMLGSKARGHQGNEGQGDASQRTYRRTEFFKYKCELS